MKKTTLLFVFLLTIALAGFTQSIYEISFKDIQGDSVRISQYAGKKILFILAPLIKDSIYQQLSIFKNRYADTVQIIGIPLQNDSLQPINNTALANLYANTGVLLTELVQTSKASVEQQSTLLQWLTDKTKNHYSNVEISGAGHKFFITETGRLYAALKPQTSLQSVIVNRIVSGGSR